MGQRKKGAKVMKRVDFDKYFDFLEEGKYHMMEGYPELEEDLKKQAALLKLFKDEELAKKVDEYCGLTASTYQKYGFDLGVEYALQQIEPTTISDIMREVQKLVQTVMHALEDVAPSKESLRYVLSLADNKIEDLQMEILDKKEALYPKTKEPMDKGQPTIDMIS